MSGEEESMEALLEKGKMWVRSKDTHTSQSVCLDANVSICACPFYCFWVQDCLSDCLLACLLTHLSVVSIFMSCCTSSACLSVILSLSLSHCLAVILHACLSAYLSVCLSLSVWLDAHTIQQLQTNNLIFWLTGWQRVREKRERGGKVEQETHKTCWISALPGKKGKNRGDRWRDGGT